MSEELHTLVLRLGQPSSPKVEKIYHYHYRYDVMTKLASLSRNEGKPSIIGRFSNREFARIACQKHFEKASNLIKILKHHGEPILFMDI